MTEARPPSAPSVLRCRCGGNNAECHMCFGTGEISEGVPEFVGVGAPRPARVPRQVSVRKEERPKDLRSLVRMHAGLALQESLKTIFEALDRCAAEGDPRLETLLQFSLQCPKTVFGRFVHTLDLAIRTASGKAVTRDCGKLAALLAEGGVRAPVPSELIEDLAAARLAEVRARRAAAARHPAATPGPPEVKPKKSRSRVLQPVGPSTSGRGSGTGAPRATAPVFGAYPGAPAAEPEAARGTQAPAVPTAVIVTGTGIPSEARLREFGRVMRGLRAARVYANVPKKALRRITAEFPGLDLVHVTNAAHVAHIRMGGDAVSIDLD